MPTRWRQCGRCCEPRTSSPPTRDRLDTRTLVLTLHIAAAGSWLGADVLVHALTPRLEGDRAAAPTWARAQVWLHDRYYLIVAVVLLATGVLLVLDGGWSWSSDFTWVGVGAVVAALGGGGLDPLSKRRLAAQTAGDLRRLEQPLDKQ